MAKSSRSKWKKLHRRQKAKEESTNTIKRIRQLNKKLELTVKGGISAVPPQEPEKRFHFLNPELDPRVPNTRKDLNNNYRAELNHVHYDYTKPLKLAAPKTNLHGKSNPDAPHPMTQNFESIDADAPIGGHALTKADVERMARRQLEKEAEAAALANEEVDAQASGRDEAEGSSDNEAEEDDDGPEEYVFGMTDKAPRRAGKSSKKKMAEEDDDEDEELVTHAGGKRAKITSMEAMHKKNGVTVSASGASKMKKVGSQGGASGTRVVSSGGKAALKKTGKKKNAV